jgi:hypothetical protein
MGFLVAVQSAWMVVLGMAVDEGCLQSLLDVPLAHPPHGHFADVQRFGDGLVIPPGSIRARVGLEQNARMGQLAGRRLAG